MTMMTNYILKVGRVRDIAWKQKVTRSKAPHLYVQVIFGDDTKRTRTIKGDLSPSWNDTLAFSSSDMSEAFLIELRHESLFKIRASLCIGSCKITVSDLMSRCADGDACLDLHTLSKNAPSLAGVICMRLTVVNATTSAKSDITSVVQDAQKRIGGKPGNRDGGKTMYQAISGLCSQLDVLVSFFDEVSKIHPCIQIAWLAASSLLKAISIQIQVDEKLMELVQIMEEAFEFVLDIESLPGKAQRLEQVIIKLLNQVTECCLFVRQYIRHGFVGRIVHVNSSQKIDEFSSSLTALKRTIDSGVTLQVAFVSARMSEKIDEILLYHRLNPHQIDVSDRPLCFPGTRIEVQRKIVYWMLSETTENILWLHGVAGSGKSTISMTIAEHFRNISRLGAFLSFERGKSEPSSVIRTVAYKLALFDSAVGSHIVSAANQDKDIASASSASQFEKLLLQPLTAAAAAIEGPIIIVLDALDECGDPGRRRNLVQLVANDFPRISPKFRFLITSRREPDIDKALSLKPNTVYSMEMDYTSESSRKDVLSYIRHELQVNVRDVVFVPEDWPWEENMSLLGDTAAGLFIWAATAVKVIASQGDDPFQKLVDLVSDVRSLSAFGLHDLYARALRGSGISWNNNVYKQRFTQVFGLVLLSKIPLSISKIDAVLGYPPEKSSGLILSRLLALMDYTPDGPVRLLHASLSDYMTSPERSSDPWFIDIPTHLDFIANRCLDRMNETLHFNPCHIETSYIVNDRIPGLQHRVNERLVVRSSYICCYWARHLHDTPYTARLYNGLSHFLHTHFLHWLETLSLLKESKHAGPAIMDAILWIEDHESELCMLLRDSHRLITLYDAMIPLSGPHIYLSLLPLSSRESRIAEHYRKSYSSLVHFDQHGADRLSPLLSVSFLQGPTRSISSIGFSQDRCLVITGGWDHKIRIWDRRSGKLAFGPFTGHSDTVWAVAFSQNGSRIASSSEDDTIRIWDSKTGNLISGPFRGHDSLDRCVAFSADGLQLASGSRAGTVSIWNTETGELKSGPFNGHTEAVWGVSFSPDGKHLATGSRDLTIRIWDRVTACTVRTLSEGHTDGIRCVAYSPDGSKIASGAEDRTVIVWDIDSGNIISGPFIGHTQTIFSVIFSLDGMQVISGAEDDTMMTWDVANGQDIPGLIEEHSFRVLSVAFSPVGPSMALGFQNGEIRILDSKTGEIACKFDPSQGHMDGVTALRFSPDGKRLASGSIDRTVRIWSTKGELISGPYAGHRSRVSTLAFSPNATHIASASWDCCIRISDIEQSEEVFEPLKHDWGVCSVLFFPDGSRIVSGSGDKTIRIWDAKTGQAVSPPFTGHTEEIVCVDLSPDGTKVVSGSLDKTIRLWNAQSGEAIAEPFQEHTGAIRTVAFSRDGSKIISGSWDCTIRVWDAIDGRLFSGPFAGHTDTIIAASTLWPDDSRIISVGKDNTIRIWDIKTGQLVDDQDSNDGRTFNVLSVEHSIGRGGNSDWTLSRDGWVLGRHKELLLWVPPHLRIRLWRPSSRLDFTNAAHGTRWQEIINQPRSF